MRKRFPLLSMVLGLLAAFLLVSAGPANRFHVLDFRAALGLLRYGATVGVGAILLAVVSLFFKQTRRNRGRLTEAFIGLILGVCAFGFPIQMKRTAERLPMIHDITTDTENPPEFAAILPLRAGAPNPVSYGGPEIAAKQKAAYPQIKPRVLDLPMDRAFDAALSAAREMGWQIIAADSATHRIEATATTLWFGFKDDIVVRLTPEGARTRVDVRSVSRVGLSDLGLNAKRIRQYLDHLR